MQGQGLRTENEKWRDFMAREALLFLSLSTLLTNESDVFAVYENETI